MFHKNLLSYFCVFFIAIMQCLPLCAGKSKSDTQTPVNSNIFNITDYGISPDSKSDAAPAILKAIKDAQKYVKSTGQHAEVLIPTGSFFVSQSEFSNLNNITVHLASQAQINAFPKSSSTKATKPYFTIENSDTFVFYGEEGSVIDGAGSSWWNAGGDRPDFISLENCSNYELYGFSITNSPNHTIKLSSCKEGKIHDLIIESPQDSPSTDGIDPMSDVDGLEIYNCQISNGDDCIAINANTGPMNNIHIHDCILKDGHGLSFGSAINYDITNVLIENITLDGTQYGIRFKFAYSDKKAKVKNISINNVKASNLSRDAIRITTEYSTKPNANVVLKDISFNDFVCTGADSGLDFTVTDKKQVASPIILNNVSITGTKHKDNIQNCPVIINGKSK